MALRPQERKAEKGEKRMVKQCSLKDKVNPTERENYERFKRVLSRGYRFLKVMREFQKPIPFPHMNVLSSHMGRRPWVMKGL